MFRVFEQGRGKGIGLDFGRFLRRFDEICAEHIAKKRAKAFAFIFYNPDDADLRQILKDQGVFAQLDRLSGDKLSIFYLHTGDESTVRRFNQEFFSRLNLDGQAEPPCVVFFRVENDGARDVAVAQLDSADALHGFHELYGVIDRYLKNESEPGYGANHLGWIKSIAKVISLEALRAGLRSAFSHFP